MRVRSTSSSGVTLASGFVFLGRRFLVTKGFLAAGCPCCGKTAANTHHARLSHRAGAQMSQRHVHGSRSLPHRRVTVHLPSYILKVGYPISTDRDLRMDITIEKRGDSETLLRQSAARSQTILLLDDTRVQIHKRRGSHRTCSTNQDASAVSLSETRKVNHYIYNRPVQASFDEGAQSYPYHRVGGIFGCVGEEGGEDFGQLPTTGIIGLTDGRSPFSACLRWRVKYYARKESVSY